MQSLSGRSALLEAIEAGARYCFTNALKGFSKMISTINEAAPATARKRLFPRGQTYLTPGATDALSEAGQGAAEFLKG